MPAPLGDSAPLPQSYDVAGLGDAMPLSRDVTCDLAVVGAGITGASTALHVVRSGRSVALLEEKEAGAGGSGRAFGQVVSFGKHSESWYRQRYGAGLGERMIDWLATGPDQLFGLVEQYDISCSARRTGLFFAAHNEKAAVGLKERARYWQSKHAAVETLEGDALWYMTGSAFYDVALWDKRAGSINPLAFNRGLVAAAMREGAGYYPSTPALGLKRDGRHWVVETPGGVVRASSVALCTESYSGKLWPALKKSLVPLRSYQLTSAPLSSNLRRTILPDGQALTDTRRTFSAIRVLDDGRLHLTVSGPSHSARGAPDFASATRRLADVFPQMGVPEWDDAWTGWVGVNTRQVPRLSQLAEKLWTVAGYSGRGLALGVLMGRELALRVEDAQHPGAVCPVEKLVPLPGHGLGRHVAAAFLKFYAVLDERELDMQRRKVRQREAL